jgi:hypothetical protein
MVAAAPHTAPPKRNGDVDELEEQAEDRELDRLAPQLGPDDRTHDLRRRLHDGIRAVVLLEGLEDGLGARAQVRLVRARVGQADEDLVLGGVVVGLDGRAGRHLVHGRAHAVHFGPVLEARDELRAPGELHAVTDALRRDVGDPAQDEGGAQREQDLRLAEEVVVRVLQELHGGP